MVRICNKTVRNIHRLIFDTRLFKHSLVFYLPASVSAQMKHTTNLRSVLGAIHIKRNDIMEF